MEVEKEQPEKQEQTSMTMMMSTLTAEECRRLVLGATFVFECEDEGQCRYLVWLLIDSGACDHVCLVNFCAEIPVMPSERRLAVVTADGSAVSHVGQRTVEMTLWPHDLAQVTFEVLNVIRPILSVSRLREKGFDVVFADQA